MKNVEYYLKVIKPLEKKYTKMCIFYSLFKFKYFEKKKNFYNKILNYYYLMLTKNPHILKDIEDNLF